MVTSKYHYNTGLEHLQNMELEEANSYFKLALQEDPDFANSHSSLASTYKKQGKLKKAWKHFLKAYSLEPLEAVHEENLKIFWTYTYKPFHKIEPGMTEEEIVNALGKPEFRFKRKKRKKKFLIYGPIVIHLVEEKFVKDCYINKES